MKLFSFGSIALLSTYLSAAITHAWAAQSLEPYRTFEIREFKDKKYAVTLGALAFNTKVRIRIIKRAKTELALFFWDTDKNSTRHGIGETDGWSTMPTQVWQADPQWSTMCNSRFNRDTSIVADGQVLEYSARGYRPPGGNTAKPIGIAVISASNFCYHGDFANITSCVQDGDAFHIHTSDGWEFEIKVVRPDF